MVYYNFSLTLRVGTGPKGLEEELKKYALSDFAQKFRVKSKDFFFFCLLFIYQYLINSIVTTDLILVNSPKKARC